MSRDDAVVYDSTLAGDGDIESSAKHFAEDYAEVRYDDEDGESAESYWMCVAVIDDADVEVASFKFKIVIDFDPIFTATEANDGT